MKDYQKSAQYFTRGLKLSSKIGSKSLQAWNYYGLGSVSLDQNIIDKAYDYGQKAFSLANEIGEFEIIKESSDILSKASAALGLYKDAYEYQLIFKAMSDSVMNEENTRRTIGLEYEYKYEREKQLARLEQEKKDAVHQEELKHQKNIRNSFMLALLMVLFALALVYYNFVQKRKTNRMLTEQKNEIIMRNEELLQLNEEIRSQKEHIEKSHEQITQSITYAQLIQNAVLPNHDIVSMLFPEHFILYMPCEIVSGDFYFIKQVKHHTIIAAADCTGHGVPGAFMSMLGIAMLNEIVRHTDIHTSSQVLTELRNQLKRSLQQSGNIGDQPEGMDIAFCAINLETMEMSFAGAHNPCWIVRPTLGNSSQCELIVLDADRITLGASSVEKPFTEHKFNLQKNDTIYLFTDGYYTQFGGERKEKFQVKRLQSALMQIQGLKLIDQKVALEGVFKDWMGDNLQTDDVLVLGFKI
jgi:serine phosphatase RsbU (regulator of sigma subunit)